MAPFRPKVRACFLSDRASSAVQGACVAWHGPAPVGVVSEGAHHPAALVATLIVKEVAAVPAVFGAVGETGDGVVPRLLDLPRDRGHRALQGRDARTVRIYRKRRGTMEELKNKKKTPGLNAYVLTRR